MICPNEAVDTYIPNKAKCETFFKIRIGKSAEMSQLSEKTAREKNSPSHHQPFTLFICKPCGNLESSHLKQRLQEVAHLKETFPALPLTQGSKVSFLHECGHTQLPHFTSKGPQSFKRTK